jgi:hypothetical protein
MNTTDNKIMIQNDVHEKTKLVYDVLNKRCSYNCKCKQTFAVMYKDNFYITDYFYDITLKHISNLYNSYTNNNRNIVHNIFNYYKNISFRKNDLHFLLKLNDDEKISQILMSQIQINNINLMTGKTATNECACCKTIEFINKLFENYYHKSLNLFFRFNNDFLLLINFLNANIYSTFDSYFALQILNKNDNALLKFQNDEKYIQIIKNIMMHTKITDDVFEKIIDGISNQTMLESITEITFTRFNKNLFIKLLTKIQSKNMNFEKLFNNNKLSEFQVNEYIEIMCVLQFKITKMCVINLINKEIKINKFETHNIAVDDEIILECCNNNFYPYPISHDNPPKETILITECSRGLQETRRSVYIASKEKEIIDRLTDYKHKGSIFTSKCLERACSCNNNSFVINFLIEKCGLIANKTCVENYGCISGKTSLNLIMNSYCKNYPKELNTVNENVELNENELLKIPHKIIIDKNKNYQIKKKIFNFMKEMDIKYFESIEKQKYVINYNKIYEYLLKYLIKNKLVIGNYFVINEILEKYTNIQKSTIFHIDQLDNLISHIVKEC